MTNSAAHRQGDDPTIRTAFMASCPGRHEEAAGRPLAGRSGENLRAALEALRNRFGDAWFPSSRLEDYTLTNAWERVEYPALTGRSEATAAEVLAADNVALVRARTVDAGLTHIVALGERARQMAARLGATAVIAGPHPSPRHINMSYPSERPTTSERNLHRLEQWAARINEVQG
jgi:uracil-DNA glycosylase